MVIIRQNQSTTRIHLQIVLSHQGDPKKNDFYFLDFSFFSLVGQILLENIVTVRQILIHQVSGKTTTNHPS